MPQHWTTVHAVLWAILYSFTENVRGSPCAEVNSSSTMVPFGSAVTASCFINEECSLTKKQDFHMKWNKNAHFFSSSKGAQKNVYEIFISNFNDTKAVLECFICSDDNCQVVGAVEIKAVYPPSIPKNLTCLLHLNKPLSLMCMWDPGKKTSDVPTNYTLYTEFRDSPNPLQRYTYFPSPEENNYRVPRGGFPLFNEMQVYVVATNFLGQAKSTILVLDPMKTAKLDAPLIQGVGTQTFGCLEYKWSLAHTQKWIRNPINIEIKYKPVNNEFFNKEQFIRKPDNKVRLCGLLHGMSYISQMRVRYHNSSSWSEWSNAIVATTPMKAPTGQLVTWLKLQRTESKNQPAQLFWKQSLQFRPNSMNVSYIVSRTKESRKKDMLCVTAQQHCSFQIHAKFKKVYLIAINEAGKSNPTEVPVYRKRGMHLVPLVTIVPQSEDSLLVEWKILDTSAISASVLEWKALCGENLCHVSFEILDRNQTSFVLSGLKPYMPYEVSVYPGGFDPPNSTIAYTKEKAPSISPNLKIRHIRPSSVALSWNEIPLKERNGIITGYSIFYRDQKNNTTVINTEGTKRDLVLKHLYPGTNYEIFLITSTHGGKQIGSNVTVTTASFDAFEIVLIVIPACVGLTLFFFAVFTCFVKQKWMKYVWPVIPDPANSNIKKWTTADSVECMPRFKEVKDPALVYLSHVSLLSLPEKELSKEDENVKRSNWPHNNKIVDAGHDDSSRNSEGFDSEQQNESVPYATVVFAGPYQRQPVPPPVYLRSESTQPLLGEEEPSSPRPYEKITTQPSLPDVDNFSPFHRNLSVGEGKKSLLVDFPMLRSLEIN